MWCKCRQCIIYAKVFQSDRILSSTNGFIFQIISSLIESMRECLTWRDCKDLLFCCLFVYLCFPGAVLQSTLGRVPMKTVSICYFSRAEHRALENSTSRPDTVYSWTLPNSLLVCFSFWQSVQRVEMRLVVWQIVLMALVWKNYRKRPAD